MAVESDHKTYVEKHGPNLQKSHPEVYKAGKLKKAKHLLKDGDYAKALTTLGEGFNILSLRRKFDPHFGDKKKDRKEFTKEVVGQGLASLLSKKKTSADEDANKKSTSIDS